jgi:hypothetical protein
MTTRRSAEQDGFGAAAPGEAPAERPPPEVAMIDEGAADDASPVRVVRGSVLARLTGVHA